LSEIINKSGSGAKIHKKEFIRNPHGLMEHLSSKTPTDIKVFHINVPHGNEKIEE
jgi:hypothetical protein